MSRIIQAILNSTKNKSKLDSAVIFLNKQKIDIDILKLNTKLISFQKHPLDINNKLVIIDPSVVNNCLAFLPQAIICCDLGEYLNSKNLATSLKLPQINIIREHLPIKKESCLDLARSHWINDINLISDSNIANKLYITNYEIISSNLEEQILNKVNKWTAV